MNPSFLTGLIIGCFVGVVIHSYLPKIIGNRWDAEQYGEKENEWELLFNTYPAFMNQIKHDVNQPEHAQIREFFVVDKTAIMNSAIPRLRYDLSEEVISALNQLEKLGYIEKLPNDSLLYQMEEHFVRRLQTMKEVNLLGSL